MRKVSIFDNLLSDRRVLFDMLTEDEKIKFDKLLMQSFSLPFKQHRDNYYDKISLIDCAFEILSNNDVDSKAMLVCHTLQNSLSNEEVREGWRCSFSKEHTHFFYLNDRICQRRCVVFLRDPYDFVV
jgi:hypothetical protein